MPIAPPKPKITRACTTPTIKTPSILPNSKVVRDTGAKNLVIATGVSQLYVPPIPGIEHVERYDTFDTAPEGFTGQRVLVIGKGNSGFETADALVEHAAVIHVAGPHSVKLAWQTQDLNPAGACGDATNADAERGANVVDFAARKLVELLEEVDRFPLSLIDGQP